MVKVGYIITKLELGGAQKVALYVAEHIDKLGTGDYENFLITGTGGILDNEAAQNLKIYQLRNLIREVSFIKDLKALYHIWIVLRREKPDIVHTHSSKAGILGRIAAKLAGVKIVVHTVHGYGFNETQRWFVKYFYVWVEKICSWFSDKLVAVAQEDIKKGVKYGVAKEKKFALIRAGIDTAYYKTFTPDPNFKKTLLKNSETKIISTIGPFKPQKNLSDFIKAASIVVKKIDNVKFVVAGDGEQRVQLEKLIADLKLQDKVLLLGWQSDIANILYSSDIFVMTSLWEGLPRTILEAMCCGKPVVANAVDGVKEIIQEGITGFKVEPYDYKYTAEKIIYLLENDDTSKKMGLAGKQAIDKEYDINYMVVQHDELYRSLIESRKKR